MPDLRFWLLAASWLGLFGTVRAAPGEIDITFGAESFRFFDPGKVHTDFMGSSRDASQHSLALQPDGKIVVAGESYEYAGTSRTPGNFKFALVRYLPDGELDTSFGSEGEVETAFGSGEHGREVAVQSDGKIVLVGDSYDGSQTDVILVRYNGNGSLDPSFGSNGIVKTDIGSGSVAVGLAILADGKILVAANADGTLALARYGSNGAVDPSFGAGGIVKTDFGRAILATDMTLQSDGKIVVVGTTADTHLIAVARYLPNGTLDAGFGSGGLQVTTLGIYNTQYGAVACQADGKLLVAGSIGVQRRPGRTESALALARLKPDGVPDITFGSSGIVTTFGPVSIFGGSFNLAQSIALQVDQKIVVGGALAGLGEVLIRFHPDGTIDRSFGIDGAAEDHSTIGFSPSAFLIRDDGKLLVLSGFEFGLARFRGGDVPAPLTAPLLDTAMPSSAGTAFREFSAPAVDTGMIAGGAKIVGANGRTETAIFADEAGTVLARAGGTDSQGSEFLSLGDPAVGGQAVSFPTVIRPGASLLPSGPEQTFAATRVARPGGKIAAFYTHRAAGLTRLAAQTEPAPGIDGGQFAKFLGFGLPRDTGRPIFAATLHRGGEITKANDFGVWRETGAGSASELLLRNGSEITLPGGAKRTLTKLALLAPIAKATDQRRSFAPDGGLAAVATFADGRTGIVRVAPDGNVDVPVDSASPVPDEAGVPIDGARFLAFDPPAIRSGRRYAFLADFDDGLTLTGPAPEQAIFASEDGTLRRVLDRSASLMIGLSRYGNAVIEQIGSPLIGESGMVGFVGTINYLRPARNTVVAVDGPYKVVVANIGDPAWGLGRGVVYRRILSAVVTDSQPGRLVFTASVSGPGVNAGNNVGLWSFSVASGVNLLLRKGSEITIGRTALTVRTFDALQAPRGAAVQGRGTDASGFVVAKVKLSDGRSGVLRIPLP